MLSLARELVARGSLKPEEIVFVVRSAGAYLAGFRIAEASEFSAQGLNSDDSAKGDGPEAEALIRTGARIAVIDRLETTAHFVKTLQRAHVKVVCFDDLGPGGEISDLAINAILDQNSASTNQRQGFEYLILSSSENAPHCTGKGETRILASFGGYDARDLVNFFVSSLPWIPFAKGTRITIVAGDRPGRNIDRIRDAANLAMEGRGVEILVCRRVNDFWRLVSQSDVGVVSGGLTLFEFAARGVATVSLPQYEHQLGTLKKFSELGGTRLASDGMALDRDKFTAAMTGILNKSSLRADIAAKATALVDGKGVSRVAREIETLLPLRAV